MSEHPNAAIARTAYRAIEQGDMATFAGLLDEEIVWHESTAGFEGDYKGREETMALMARVFQEAGVQMIEMSIHDILADDDHVVVLHESTMSRGARTITAQYVDVYHVRDGKATEHWHLAVDPKADDAFFSG